MKYSYTRTYCGPVQLVVFDWAGTTVDFGCQAPIVAFIEGFREQGIEITKEQARGPMGMEKKDHIKTVAAMEEVARAWHVRYGRSVNDTDIDEMYERFVPMLMNILPSHSTIIPGVLNAVAALREMRIKIGATTGYFRDAADTVSKSAAQQGFHPDVSISSSEVPFGRPAPWLIFRVMETLNVYPPASVINVGDTVVDIESGLNAGAWSIGVAATGNETGLTEKEFTSFPLEEREALVAKAREKLVRAGAHFVINTMDALPGIVSKINSLLQKGYTPS